MSIDIENVDTVRRKFTILQVIYYHIILFNQIICMRYLRYLLFIIIPCSAFAQNQVVIDSLTNELKHTRNKSEIYNLLGEEYILIKPQKALEFADKAITNAAGDDISTQLARALWIKSRVYLSFYNYKMCLSLADSARTLFSEAEKYDDVINCEVIRATVYMLKGNYRQALDLYDSCASEAKKLGAQEIYGSILINIGRIYRVSGNLDDAMDEFLKVRDIAEEIDDNYLKAHAYHFIGMVYEDKQDFEPAIENLLKALPLFEKEQLVTQIPYLYISLGSACREIQNYREALEYLKQADKLLKETNDTWGLYEVNRHLGLTYSELEQYDSAWVHHNQSLEFSRKIHERAGECNSLTYLGDVLIMQGKYTEALEYLNNALNINAELGNQLVRTNLLYNIGKCQVHMGKVHAGLDNLEKGLSLADSLNLRYERMVLHNEISKAYTRLNNFSEALWHYQQYSNLNDSIYQEEANRNFIEMEKKYQSEKQKQEIGQLKLEKTEQDAAMKVQRYVRDFFILGFLFASIIGFLFYRSYRTRKRADQEKEALLKEIHHRVKNNLQIISSLLSIQTDNVTDTNVISAVRESQSRVKAMALIHQLLYQDKDLTQINFSTYLPQLLNAISSIFKKEGAEVISEIYAENISFDIDTAIPLGLIVTELAANAYKYAFNGGKDGKLSVRISRQSDHQYLLAVTDNGPGLPDNKKIDELNSMGLRLVKILTNQLDGTFSYEYEHGSAFKILFSDAS